MQAGSADGGLPGPRQHQAGSQGSGRGIPQNIRQGSFERGGRQRGPGGGGRLNEKDPCADGLPPVHSGEPQNKGAGGGSTSQSDSLSSPIAGGGGPSNISETPPKRKRGRPKGSKNKPKRLKHVNPVTAPSDAAKNRESTSSKFSRKEDGKKGARGSDLPEAAGICRDNALIPNLEGHQPRRGANDGVLPGDGVSAASASEYPIDYRPHIKQSLITDAINNGAKIILFIAGIRSGKSWAAAYECLANVYMRHRPDMTNLGYVVTPTIGMSRVPRRLFIQAAGDLLVRYKRASDEGPPHALLRPCQAMPDYNYLVEFHTGEHPDRLRGASVSWAWLDEAAYMKAEVYDIVLGRVMENKGIILITTSPSTPGHWTSTEVYDKAARCGVCDQFYHDHKYKRVGDKLVPNDHRPYNVKGDKSIAVITCATFDNTYLDPTVITELKERYTLKDPIIARRELYGEICGFEGLIYRHFNRKENHSRYTLANVPDEALLVGGIDWGANDPFVAVIGALIDNEWHIVWEYYYQDAAPRSYRDHIDAMRRECPVPLERVSRWWYDPSGKQGATEFRQLNLGTLMKARRRKEIPLKQWRVDRINMLTSVLLAKNEARESMLRVNTDACPGTTNDFENRKWKRWKATGDDGRMRVVDSKGHQLDRNAGDEPAPGNDHGTDACLSADSLVQTLDGEKYIGTISPGEFVLTRKGYREVLWSGMTRAQAPTVRVNLSDGNHLVCTGNHPIYVSQFGWKQASDLIPGDELVPDPQRWLCSKGSSTDAIRMRRPAMTVFTSRATDDYCTANFGSTITETSEPGWSSTIGMETQATTPSKTWTQYPQRNTHESIGQKSGPSKSGSISTPFGTSHLTGTGQRPDGSGTPIRQRSTGSASSGRGGSVDSAGSGTPQKLARPFTVERLAGLPSIAGSDSTIRVTSVTPDVTQPVYNLSVKDHPEFFANGVLVHNCEYMITSEMVTGKYRLRRAEKPKHEPHNLIIGDVKLSKQTSNAMSHLTSHMVNHAQNILSGKKRRPGYMRSGWR